eukprot:231247-Rhodomonas_salina.1
MHLAPFAVPFAAKCTRSWVNLDYFEMILFQSISYSATTAIAYVVQFVLAGTDSSLLVLGVRALAVQRQRHLCTARYCLPTRSLYTASGTTLENFCCSYAATYS